MNQPQKMTVEELLERNPIKRPTEVERILPSPEVSKPQLSPIYGESPKPKIEFIHFPNSVTVVIDEITNEMIYKKLCQIESNTEILAENIKNIINHINNE